MNLAQKINNKKATVAVLGLGYVGLPLVNGLLHAGFPVIGIDIDSEKIRRIKEGSLEGPFFCQKTVAEKAKITADFSELQNSDIDVICVPTPVRGDLSPDLSMVQSAAREIARRTRSRPKLVIVESTIYFGALRNEIYPLFTREGLLHNRDFYLAYAPERIDPGNKTYGISNTPRVVGGMSEAARRLAAGFYKQLVDQVVEVSTAEIAEMVKLLENSFRCLNIAFINELEHLCRHNNINIFEVIDSAETKPFGYMPFYPGPGVGGHCITTDPLFLAWQARQQGIPCTLLEMAAKLNRERPLQVVAHISKALSARNKSLKGASILLLGIAYKKNVADTRESPAIKIFELLLAKGAEVQYYDPFVPQIKIAGKYYSSIPLLSSLFKEAECIVITTDHDGVDYAEIKKAASLLVDTRGAGYYSSISRGEKEK